MNNLLPKILGQFNEYYVFQFHLFFENGFSKRLKAKDQEWPRIYVSVITNNYIVLI